LVQASLGKNQDHIAKITRTKGAGSMAQAVENLPHKHEALNLNSNTTKKTNKKPNNNKK
jgi:hypothetical protein